MQFAKDFKRANIKRLENEQHKTIMSSRTPNEMTFDGNPDNTEANTQLLLLANVCQQLSISSDLNHIYKFINHTLEDYRADGRGTCLTKSTHSPKIKKRHLVQL